MPWRIIVCLLILSSLVLGETLETQVIEAAVKRNVPREELRPVFVKLLKAIRLAENGKPGREFGVLSHKADTFEKQAGWCASICYKNYVYWELHPEIDQDFISYLGSQYAPIGAANDPSNLNSNWVKNVRYHFNKE